MKLTCLVTAQPAEGESIEVEFACDKEWPSQLTQILTLLDNRLAEMNMRTVQDTKALDSLTTPQYKKLLDIITIQFPYTHIQTSHLSFADLRLLIRKMTNNREQIALRFDLSHNDNIQEALCSAFTTLDQRMIDTNARDLQAYTLLNTCTVDDKQPIQMVLDCLYGRADPKYVGLQLASQAMLEAKNTLEEERQQLAQTNPQQYELFTMKDISK